jgi:hypothetical protein
MKKVIQVNLLLIALILTTAASGQIASQTIRGTVIDADSKLPLTGAVVKVVGTEPLIGTLTDENGNFRLDNVPIGRVSVQLYLLGYQNISIPNIVVNSGKEVIINPEMQESTTKMNEVVVLSNKNKGEPTNDMALISGRSISAEETNRYAGGFNDPSRILSNFAGVTSTGDGGNDIIVRGNAPKYVQWRLEGVQITNPNHFSDPASAGGAVSTLNNNLLATSDFYTGAFSPEYGDALSGVYDVKLRVGNNEKLECMLGLGITGSDITLEGPFKKGYGGSFLANYRYSTASLISNLGLVDISGIPKFQDAAFKVVLPTKKAGNFSLFGLGGLSSFLFENVKPSVWVTPGNNAMKGDIKEDYKKGSHLANIGMNHTIFINNNSFIKTALSFSSEGIKDDIFESKTIKIKDNNGNYLRDSVIARQLNFQNRLVKSIYRGSITYNNKINSKNKIQIGTRYSLFDYDMNQSNLVANTSNRFTLIDFKENISTINNFISWKHRLNDNISIVGGVHNMNVLYNQKSTIEPRLAVKWQIDGTNSVNIGYGKHSTMESVHNYFTKVQLKNGSIIEPNKDLDLLKAHHFVMGYEKRFSKNLVGKVELYYQHLYNLPVENTDTSYYATINEGLEFNYVDLVNKGKGKNYGIELTLERFFSRNYYYMINASVYQSKYKSLEGIERNTQFNSNYLVNILMGKEFVKLGRKKNQTLGINGKVFFGGGKRIIPLLRDNQGNVAVDPANNSYWDYKKAYDRKLEDIYQVTASVSYKFNRKKTTHELFLNLDNLTNTKGRLSEFYDESVPNKIGYTTQFGLFPNILYRVYF